MTEDLITDLGGCGRFQILLTVYLRTAVLALIWTIYTNSYGIHNPGWRCLDDLKLVGLINSNSTSKYHINTTYMTPYDNVTSYAIHHNNTEDLTQYGRHSCDAFEKCQQVEFEPSTVTLVSEWQMICNRKWMMSTMLVITNVGELTSNIFVGYIGDRFGRKFPGLFARIFSAVILNFVSAYSTSWLMYVIIHFVIGVLKPFESLWDVLLFELVPTTWRIRVHCLGIVTTFSILHALVAWYLKDWRKLLLMAAALAIITQVPGFWLPESLRWLIATGKKEEASKVIERIAKVNKKDLPKVDYVEVMTKRNLENTNNSNHYTYLDLFRKGFRLRTIIIGVIRFTIVMVYYTLHYTVITLPGNVYMHMIISYLVHIPGDIIAFTVANKVPRKRVYCTSLVLVTLSLLGLVITSKLAHGHVLLYVNLTFVLLAKSFNRMKWMAMSTAVVEMYPTVVRSNILTFHHLMSSTGSLIAPFLIPTSKDAYFQSFTIMTAICAVSTTLSFFLPETKDVPLMDTFPEDHDKAVDKEKEKKYHENGKKQSNGVV